MLSAPVRFALAASALATLLLLPEAAALGPSLPAAPAGQLGPQSPVIAPHAGADLVAELAGQALKGLGVPGIDAFRLANRAVGLSSADDAAQQMDFLAQDAAALSGADEAAARDVFARVEALMKVPYLTSVTAGRAFGIGTDGAAPVVLADAADRAGIQLPADAPAPMVGGTCLTCPNFDFGIWTPTPAWQTHASSLATGTDCAWYAFTVTNGATYEFTTCAPGSAAFDTVLDLFSSTCAFISTDDDACAPQSRITWTANFSGDVRLKVRGFGGATGSFTLAYRRLCIGEPDCTTTTSTLATPTTACQYQAGTLSPCSLASYYHVDMYGGQTYTFTLCGSTCPSANAPFDSIVDVYDGAVLLGSNSNACGDDGEVVVTPSTGGLNTYCVVVRSEGGVGTDFTLGYRVACQAPSSLGITPATASTSEPDCTRNQIWTATTAGTGPFDWTWTVTPTGSQTASPSLGTGTTSGSSFNFNSLLTGAGDYIVTVTATNECGTTSATITYNLEDRAGPLLTPTADQVNCRTLRAVAPAPATSPLHAAEQIRALSQHEMAVIMAEPDPAVIQAHLAEKLGVLAKNIVVLDRTSPGVSSPPGTMALNCPSPCTGFGTLEADNPFYDVFLNCDDGSYTARTGAAHSVTIAAGSPQNVIFGGAGGGPGTSDAAWYVHDNNTYYNNPNGGSACIFDPPDTASQPNSVGLEAEWHETPMPGVQLTLREEVVAFGDSEPNSGVRLTLGATNSASSTQAVDMGVRWQIDYQNAFDDGPLFAQVRCQPFEVTNERSTEHEFTVPEIDAMDFYRIQNNTGTPIFGNFTNAAPIAGFPDTGKPDRLVYAYWGSAVSSAWNYPTSEGSANPDFDSAVLYWFGHDVGNAIRIAPGETFTRSVIIFTAGNAVDCGTFRPGECANEARLEICPNECARVGATAIDGCGPATVDLISTSPGAPPCAGNPCVISFPDEGEFVYTWRATDAAGNMVECTSTVVVTDGPSCNQPPSCNAGGPYRTDCREAAVDGASVDDLDGDEILYTWISDNPSVTVSPATGVIAAGFGPRALPPTVATLDASVDPCGVVANLTLVVDDGRGGGSACTTTVTFLDDVAPVVVPGSAGPSGYAACLWPPNHWYVPVDIETTLGALVTDNCTAVTYRVTGCISDQPEDAPDPGWDAWNGDGNTDRDCVISADGRTAYIRSERCGAGPDAQGGRHYGFLIVATDACGNESAPTMAGKVYVPHDQSPAEDGCLDPTVIGFQELP